MEEVSSSSSALTAPAPSMVGDGKGSGNGSSNNRSSNNNSNKNNNKNTNNNDNSSSDSNKDNTKKATNDMDSTDKDNNNSSSNNGSNSNREINKNNNNSSNKNNATEAGHGDSISRNDLNGSTGAGVSNNSPAAAAAAAPAVAGDPSHPLDEGGCFVCKRNDQQDLILLCDGCDGEYHTFCVKPPVRKIPENEWFCHQCKATGKGGPKPDPVSRYTGVYWAGTVKANVCTAAWTAKIRRRAGRGEATIGSYPSEKEAAGAYDAEAKRVFGDAHPPLNFPDGNWDDEPDEPEASEELEAEERDGPKRPEDPGVLRQQDTPDEPQQRGEPGAPGLSREVGESRQEKKASEPTQREEPDDPPKQAEEPVEFIQPDELDEPERPEGRDGPGQQEEANEHNQQEQANEPSELSEPAEPPQDADTLMTEHVSRGDGGGDGVGDAVWVNISDVGGRGTSISGRREVSFAAAGSGSSSRPRTGGTSSGRPSSMHAGGAVGGSGVRGSSARNSGAGNILSGPGTGTAQNPSSVTSNGLSGMRAERPASAGVGATGKAAAVPRHNDGRSGDDRTGTPGVIGMSSAGASSARPEISGLGTSRGDGGENRGAVGERSALQARPQLSVDIPVDRQDAEVGGSSLPSQRDTPNIDLGGSTLSTPTETPTGRKRVKAKWLQEYEQSDDRENAGARSPRATSRGKKSDKHRGSTETRDNPSASASAEVAGGNVRNASQSHSTRKRGIESDDAAGGSPRSSADGAAKDRKKGKGKAIPTKKKVPWGGRDWAGHALSKSSLALIKDTVRMWATSEDGTLVGEDGNHFFCSVCGEHGELTCCDYCPRVFHEECLTLGSDSQLAAEHQTAEDPWYCPSCVEAGQVNLVQGIVPEWTPEQRQQTPKPVTTKKAEKTSGKTSANSSSSKTSKGGHRRSTSSTPSLPSPRPEVAAAKKNAPKRAATGQSGATSAAATAAAAAATVVSQPPATANVNDAADPPLLVSRVNVFAPELDNVLLRSLLYDEKYTHVLPKTAPAKKQKAGGRTRASQSRAAAQGRVAEEKFATTATFQGDQGDRNLTFDVRTGMPIASPEPALGALTAHLPLSSQAGKRPKNLAHNNGTRLGPSFGGPTGPTGVLDGTAVTFGARAMGSFRGGLAANMVDVGLVPDEVAAEARYSRLMEAENALVKEAENTALAGSSAARANPFGSASADWSSRAPANGKGYSGTGQHGRSQRSGGFGGDPAGRGSGYPYDGAGGIGGARRDRQHSHPDDAVRPGQGSSRANDTRQAAHRLDRTQAVYAERGSSASSGFRRTSDPAASARPYDDMDVEEEMRDEVWDPRGTERGHGGSNNGPNYTRKGPSASAGQGREPVGGRPWQEREGARAVEKVNHDKGLETNKEIRKENRRWNLKHMRATQDEGKMDVCAYCRLHPDGGLMVCANHELARVHSFCFPCLAKKQSIEKNKLTAGSVKWNCPTCRERKERPQRRAQPPSSLRGAAWAGGGVLTSPCALPHGAGHQSSGANGRFREPERGAVSCGESRGIKRTLSSTEISTAARENQGRSSPPSFLPEVLPSSSSVEVGADAYAFRRDASPRGSDASGGGGSGGGSAAAVGGEGWSEEGPAPPAKPPIERKRLLRLVATLALDRLQELDPLDLFKDPVPSGVAGYAETIDFPIDFSTIRRRSQWGLYASIGELALEVDLLCANAKAFNAPGTVYHTAAISVLEGAKRLWPRATNLLDSLSSAETKAAKHLLRGPAASSDAWPLDGPFAGFEVTPANESAYYMHIAIRRAAAAYRAREEEEAEHENTGEACLGIVGHGNGNGIGGRGAGGERGEGRSNDDGNEGRVKVAVRTAVFAASSAAFLYTRGQMSDEESLLRDSLSAFKADHVEKSLRRAADCAKCEPIDRATLSSRGSHTRPLPTPVTRRKAAPDGEFLALDPANDQPGPMGPNPKLEEKTAESTAVTVAPEWRVLQAAHGAKQRSGEESARHMRTFRKFFKDVDARSKTRLRVEKSTVQGLGVFAAQAIRAHELVAEYKGERLNLEEAQKRAATYRETNVMDFVVRLDEKNFIDATKKGNISRFLNHSCAPNCYVKTVAAGKEQALDKRVCFFSLREIRSGEEISYAYPAPHKIGLGAVVAPECACRAPGCRGRMSTREQL